MNLTLFSYLHGKISKFCIGVDLQFVSERIVSICKIMSRAPPCLRYAVLAMWSNAWCTDGRFQIVSACPFCDDANAVNDLSHFCVCENFWKFMHNKMFLDLHCSASNFFLPGCEDVNSILKWASSIYALYSQLNAFRQSQSPVRDYDSLKVLLWGHCKVASLHCKHLRGVLMSCHPNST